MTTHPSKAPLPDLAHRRAPDEAKGQPRAYGEGVEQPRDWAVTRRTDYERLEEPSVWGWVWLALIVAGTVAVGGVVLLGMLS